MVWILSSQPIIRAAMSAGVRIAWTIPNHPWIDSTEGADVRVALTVLALNRGENSTWIRVDETGTPIEERHVARLNADLSPYANVVDAAGLCLLANEGIAGVGFDPQAHGFIITQNEAAALLADARYARWCAPTSKGETSFSGLGESGL